MLLATRDDYDYPHIDWVCDHCGTVYVSSGKPDTDYCPGGDHPARWRPNDNQMEKYIDLLESLEPGDGVLVAGFGPAPLMGRVKAVSENELRTESIDSPARIIRWDRGANTIQWGKAEGNHPIIDDVYHVGTVPVEYGSRDGDEDE